MKSKVVSKKFDKKNDVVFVDKFTKVSDEVSYRTVTGIQFPLLYHIGLITIIRS